MTLREKYPCLDFSGSYFHTFSPNVGIYGPEKLQIRTLFTQWSLRWRKNWCSFYMKNLYGNFNFISLSLFWKVTYLKKSLTQTYLQWIHILTGLHYSVMSVHITNLQQILSKVPLCFSTSIKVWSIHRLLKLSFLTQQQIRLCFSWMLRRFNA